MKLKNQNRKLKLSKMIIANLANDKIRQLNGGNEPNVDYLLSGALTKCTNYSAVVICR
jgi:hypothetical protein